MENFVIENKEKFSDEVGEIYDRLKQIGKTTGIREGFIKEKEGNLFDGVIALYDKEGSNLRVYGIKFGSSLLIIGGGGYKPKSISALQDDDKLRKENNIMKDVSSEISKKMKQKEMKLINDFMDFDGDFNFELDDYE